MKRFLLIAAIAAPLLWSSCSGNKQEVQEDVVPKGMKALDLTHLGLPLKINVPDSNFYPVIDTMETPTGIEIKIGNHFDIIVNHAGPDEGDLAKMKPVIEAGDELPKNFTANDSTLLRWEVSITDPPMAHFYQVIHINGETYFVRDNVNNTDNAFKKEEIDRMVESAKSLRAKPAAAKPEA